MERSISISELSTENGVSVVNAYGSIIGHNEDHVDDSQRRLLIFVRHHSGKVLSSVWNAKSWSDLFCLLISILIGPIHFGIERTAKVKVSVFLFGGLIVVALGAEQLRLEPMRCQYRAEQRVQVMRNISEFIWRQNSTSQIENCHLERIEKFESHEECYCIRQASEGFINDSAYLIGWNVSSEGNEVKIQQIHC